MCLLNFLANCITALRQAYSQWKLINALLFRRPEQDAMYLQEREQVMDRLVETHVKAFQPWQKSLADPSIVAENLNDLSRMAADLGILLMSQPCSYEFGWNCDGSMASTPVMTILPSFW